MFLINRSFAATGLFLAAVAGIAVSSQAAPSAAFGLPEGVQPTLGAWFCNDDFLAPDGYKKYVDLFAEHSPYDLLTTSFRINRREITEPAFHDQVKAAVDYARGRGLRIALDLDVRLAREAFRSLYPDEQQEMLRLRTVPLNSSGAVEFAVAPETLTDHMTGNTTPYVPLSGRLVRVYSYVAEAGGILPDTIRDITARCALKVASEKEVRVGIPCDASTGGRTACVMAAFTHLTPDVYAPHLLDFQRALVEQYADVALSGLMKDEWGFPPCHGGCPEKNDFWFSESRAKAYAEATGGRDLARDCLLMHAGEQGRERERQAAINVLLKTSRERNAAIEEHYYKLAKEFFGPDAAVVTHPTWWSYPGPSEFKKNGLDWWAARRDWGQTDEETPFSVRTALAKKWGSPVWYNQYYSTNADKYRESLWTHALGGGRINYHPVYPAPEGMDIMTRSSALLAPDIVAGESRIRLLQLVTYAPIDCPVAVVFGHACAMNWAGPAYDDVGLAVTDALWQAGYYADLIPTSEIASGALKIAEDGSVTYGRQRYAAAVLYHHGIGARHGAREPVGVGLIPFHVSLPELVKGHVADRQDGGFVGSRAQGKAVGRFRPGRVHCIGVRPNRNPARLDQINHHLMVRIVHPDPAGGRMKTAGSVVGLLVNGDVRQLAATILTDVDQHVVGFVDHLPLRQRGRRKLGDKLVFQPLVSHARGGAKLHIDART